MCGRMLREDGTKELEKKITEQKAKQGGTFDKLSYQK